MKRFAEEFRVNVVVESAGTHGYHYKTDNQALLTEGGG